MYGRPKLGFGAGSCPTPSLIHGCKVANVAGMNMNDHGDFDNQVHRQHMCSCRIKNMVVGIRLRKPFALMRVRAKKHALGVMYGQTGKGHPVSTCECELEAPGHTACFNMCASLPCNDVSATLTLGHCDAGIKE